MNMKEKTNSFICVKYFAFAVLILAYIFPSDFAETCGKSWSRNNNIYSNKDYNTKASRLLKVELVSEPKEKYKILKEKLLDILNENDEDFEKRFNEVLNDEIFENVPMPQKLIKKMNKSLCSLMFYNYDKKGLWLSGFGNLDEKLEASLESDSNDGEKLPSSEDNFNSIEKITNQSKFCSNFKKWNLFKIFDYFEKLKEEDTSKYDYSSDYDGTTSKIINEKGEEKLEGYFSDVSDDDFRYDDEPGDILKNIFKPNCEKLSHLLKSYVDGEKVLKPLKKEILTTKKYYGLIKPVFTWTGNYMKKLDVKYEKSLMKVLASDDMIDDNTVKLLFKKFKSYLIVIYPLFSYSLYTLVVYLFNFDHFSIASTATMLLCALIYVSYKYIKCTNNTKYKELQDNMNT
ncbi:Plasmodium exported protein [Plasmodium gonderi]|uniref:Plasmodium exported protein n=1 Tax=Plasmodium gonderi TaxID=77519 RepID=A0A1Y1JNC4_PLAGO|nr:Plasmodium exported protein [Plasmodium gonderi]GAW81554.1 Plasmodium exported protein [Plasmodium gonderi]